MSPDEDALLNGIAADPAADLPRLVYADWLEEHGQDLRAEFIRIQCEIAKLEVGPRDAIDRNVHLWRRQQELLDGHMDKLLEGVAFAPRAGQVPGPQFYRGFLDEIQLNDDELSEQGEALRKLRPIPSRVDLSYQDLQTSLDAQYRTLIESYDFDVRSLITAVTFVPHPVQGSISISRIEDFSDGPIGSDDARSAQDTAWLRLHSLTSTHNFLSPLTVAVMLDDMPTLKVLNLANHQIDDDDVIRLLNAGILQRLSHISLIENAIGDQAALEMADRLGNSPHLKELDLRRNGITIDGQKALLELLGSKVILF